MEWVSLVGYTTDACSTILTRRKDLFINICLTLLGYLPGHIHAFYLEWVYYDRREQAREGRFATGPAAGVYSDNVQTGGQGQGYGTIQPHA